MTCPTCIGGICTNACASHHREPELADHAATHAIRAATGDRGALASARSYDVALLKAHIDYMPPSRRAIAWQTIEHITTGQRRYDDATASTQEAA